ncbi:aspartic proteinase-like protein 2 [Heracleum sosnowskyi]|uniref:Aspartic proteinase-like protein 2 n=1 Tax=Heracleum sosnowskyi TaxID=360622 RepID=A0AAD8NC15_9APIA|nr:aspartic proteinase-like protein 2 [Heracleum sosnowskyi]
MDYLRKKMNVVMLILGIVLVVESGLVSGNSFMVQHRYGARAERSLRALRAHDSKRHGRMLGAIDFPIGGKGRAGDQSLFFTKIGIGTPSKDFHLQVDTGSDLLWVHCVGCNSCPKETKLNIKLAQYDPKGSSTSKAMSCEGDFCTNIFNAPNKECKDENLCTFSITYGDGSKTGGYFVQDFIHFNQASADLKTTFFNGNVTFGCGMEKSGEDSDEAVDGIIGFGQADTSALSQLAAAKKAKKVFSHCLDGKEGGGIFSIGEVIKPQYSSTPMIPDMPHYNVIMNGLEVAGEHIEIQSETSDTGDSGTIIDSGSTLAYLPDNVLKPLMQKILAKKPNVKLHTLEDQFSCFKYDDDVDDAFPVVTFHFKGSLALKVYPHEYLFQVDDDQCFGWMSSNIQSDDGKQFTLLGDLALSNKLVVYDLEDQTIGWTPYNCSSSIKVKDERSGKEYALSSHNLSAASINSLNMAMISALLFMTFILSTLIM